MKYKLLFIMTMSVIGESLISCQDQLDFHEYSNYDKAYLTESYENVGGLVTNIYAKLDADWGNYDGATLAAACDEAEYVWTSSSVHDFYNGSWSATNPISSLWSKNYKAIQLCNQYLEEFVGLDFPNLRLNADYEAQMFRYNNYENEVRFLRAYFYFNLARQYGDVPLVTQMPSVDEVNTLTRTPVQEVFQFIEDECDDIVNKIPADYSALGEYALPDEQPETGRANRLAVLALKARTALYAASPLFNPEQNAELWRIAAEANKAVIDSCAKYGYTLGNYDNLWGSESYREKEMIFMCRAEKQSNTFEANNFPIGVEGGKGGNCPTQTLVDAYEMTNGKFWNEEGSGYSEESGSDPYANRDPRLAMTVAKNGDTGWPSYNKEALQIYYGGTNGEPLEGATPTGYYLKKYCDASINLTASSSNSRYHSWIIFRLGEFYLNYAEAIFRYTGSADNTLSGDASSLTAREAINIIRQRSGINMPPLPNEVSEPEIFWKRYKNERMVELAFEGHRFWDVRRWKEGGVLKNVTFMKITKNNNGTYNYSRQVSTRLWDDKMYLFPLPQTELTKNKNLVQNPGW